MNTKLKESEFDLQKAKRVGLLVPEPRRKWIDSTLVLHWIVGGSWIGLAMIAIGRTFGWF